MRYEKKVYNSLALISQFGINMIVPIAMCSGVGYYLDVWLDTKYWFVILFFIGAIAGFRNIYILAKKVSSEKGDIRQRDIKKSKK